MDKACHFFINNEAYSFNVGGDFFWGENKLLFEEEDNIISKMAWKDDGFTIVKAFFEDEFLKLKESVEYNIIKALRITGVSFDEASFTLEKYHNVVNTDQLHQQVIQTTRNLENRDFDFHVDTLVERFGDVLGYRLTSWIEELQKSHIQIRISRPNTLDINPLHRDGYLSYWENIINVWVPIEGCNEHSSLPVLPGSHLIRENEILRTQAKGAEINGNMYYVPGIVDTAKGDIHLVRPNPKPGEALIFTPYLIHGAAINSNSDITRVSLELRFPKLET